MKKLLSVLFIFLFSQISFAVSGDLFEVISSGQPAAAEIILCLNKNGPYSCQHYQVTGHDLLIRTVIPNHTYPSAGIKIVTPGYVVSGCVPDASGFCTFPVSNTSPIFFTLKQSYSIGGVVSGYTSSGLVLQNNGTDSLAIAQNGSFTFATQLYTDAAYNVTVATQPSGQTCTVNDGTGTVGYTNVTNIAVNCVVTPPPTTYYTIIASSGGNGSIAPNGTFQIASGSSQTFTATPNTNYAVYQWLVDGSLVQTGGTTYQLTNITASHTVTVSFSPVGYTVGGSASGIVGGGLVLQNNGGDNLTVNSDGSFTFSTPVADQTTYNVTVLTPPAGQTCNVTNGSGTVNGANVTNVSVACGYTITVSYNAIGGTVSPATPTVFVSPGARPTFTASPFPGYDVGQWVVDSVVVVPQYRVTSYQFPPVNSNQTLNITFLQNYALSGTVIGLTNPGPNSFNVNVYRISSGQPAQLLMPGYLVSMLSFTFFNPPVNYLSGDQYYVTITAQPQNPAQTCTANCTFISPCFVMSSPPSVMFSCT